MTLVAVSKDTIRANVILYFHNEFGDPISWFKGSTNVRKGYKYKDEQWIEVGETLSGLPWMRRLRIQLLADDMPPLSTIDDLTNAIWNKLQQVIIVLEPQPMLGAAAIEVLAPAEPPAQRARKARSKPRSTRQGRRVKAKRPKKSAAKQRKKSRR